MVKVSIIIPVYNSVEYIRECMESVMEQTLRDIEIIPVDAGSTDGTREILEEYAKRDVRIHILYSNQKSMGYQTNLGITAATGEYIGFCESDDYVALTMFERLYNVAVENHLDFLKSDFDMFVSSHENITLRYHILEKKMWRLYDTVIDPAEYPELLFRDVNMWNGIYSRKFIEENGIKLNETPKAAFQDVGFVLQTFMFSKRIMYVQEETNRYRRDNAGSSVYNPRGLWFIVWEFEYICKVILERQMDNPFILSAILKRFLGTVSGLSGRMIWEDGMEVFEEKLPLKQFEELFKQLYNRLEYGEKMVSGMDTSLSLQLLLQNTSFFGTYRKELEGLTRKRLCDFFQFVSGFSEAVIFGAGECGTSCYALLLNNGYKGVSVFCDNDRNTWRQKTMGLRILPVEEAVKKRDEETVFIIANVAHGNEMYGQLLKLGVQAKNICKAVNVLPHNALEIKIQE